MFWPFFSKLFLMQERYTENLPVKSTRRAPKTALRPGFAPGNTTATRKADGGKANNMESGSTLRRIRGRTGEEGPGGGRGWGYLGGAFLKRSVVCADGNRYVMPPLVYVHGDSFKVRLFFIY